MTVSHAYWYIDPKVIRLALAWSDSHKLEATAARFGVSVSTLRNWRDKRAAAQAEGGTWPSDADVTTYEARAPKRDHARPVGKLWRFRFHNSGHMLIDSTGTQRRLHALAALGWRYQDIGTRLGVTEARVGHLASGLYSTVHRDAAAAVAKVYDELSLTFGPSKRTRTYAANRGWLPPLAWDDETINDPAAEPSHNLRCDVPGRPRDPDREAKVLELTRAGLSAADIALRLRTNKRYVTRVRARYRTEGAA